MSKIGERKLPREKVRNKSITVAVSEEELNQFASDLSAREERQTASGKLRELMLEWMKVPTANVTPAPVTNGSHEEEYEAQMIEHCVQMLLSHKHSLNHCSEHMRAAGWDEPDVKRMTNIAAAQYHARNPSSPTPTSR